MFCAILPHILPRSYELERTFPDNYEEVFVNITGEASFPVLIQSDKKKKKILHRVTRANCKIVMLTTYYTSQEFEHDQVDGLLHNV